MNEDQVKGTAEKAKCKLNAGVGRMSGESTGEGPSATGAGDARKQIGDAKEEIKKDQR